MTTPTTGGFNRLLGLGHMVMHVHVTPGHVDCRHWMIVTMTTTVMVVMMGNSMRVMFVVGRG